MQFIFICEFWYSQFDKYFIKICELKIKFSCQGCWEAEIMRGCLWVAWEVQHELHHRDQLDGRARLQAEEPRGAWGGKSQGGLGEACGEYT